MDPSLDNQADEIFSDLQIHIEKKIVPDCVKNKITISQLQKDIEALELQCNKLLKAVEKPCASYFNVSTEKDGMKPIDDILKKEETTIKELSEKLEEKNRMKIEKCDQLSDANSNFDQLKEQLNQMEAQQKDLQDSKSKDSYRVLSQLMKTKFELDKDHRCVSLLLDDDQRVEKAVLVDKENRPEKDVRDNIWSKFYNLYKL